ncbi:MAG: alpha/beta fold hydrolase, partial [Armatimonadota bacterium]|nr:alpha/beta fold hydrolase [Armatimonadota bacterium]
MIVLKYILALFLLVMVTVTSPSVGRAETAAAPADHSPAAADPPGGTAAPDTKAAPIAADKKPEALVPGDYALSMPIDGVKRTVFLHVPPAYVPGNALPLVLLLHGQGGSATGIFSYTGMGDKADKAPFILACPAAQGDPPAWAVGFNSGMHDPSDIHFLGALIDQLQVMLTVDPDRVFVAGHSSGGMMAYLLASVLPDKIAAIGVVAGTIGAWGLDGKLTMIHQPARPVSVIVFHGTGDPTNPYARGDDWAYNRNFVPAVESAAYWAKVDGCTG